jgi:hypothetical protein
MCGGVLLPIVAQILPFVMAGRTSLLLDANVWTVFRRFGVPLPHPSLSAVLRQQFEAFFPAWLFAVLVPAAARATSGERDRRIAAMCACWLLAALLSVAAIRLLCAWTAVRASQPSHVRTVVLALAAIAVIAHVPGRWLMLHEPDHAGRVAAYLNGLPASERTSLYLASNPGIYVLARAPIPTRFALPLRRTAAHFCATAGGRRCPAGD